ncbi:MAG: hypothetical protein ABGX22_14305 [Pirellulaceae bacterium]|nr:hypothetical protein [Planctomycetaceae bacterium]
MTFFPNLLIRVARKSAKQNDTAPTEIQIESADELAAHPEWTECIRTRRYGVIRVRDRRVASIHFRWTVKVVSIWHVLWGRLWTHIWRSGDFCELHYDATSSSPHFVVIKWAFSHRQTTYQSTRTAMQILDQVAAIRQAHAIVFHARNDRITDQAAKRLGYSRHADHLPGRNYIKRL